MIAKGLKKEPTFEIKAGNLVKGVLSQLKDPKDRQVVQKMTDEVGQHIQSFKKLMQSLEEGPHGFRGV